MSFLHKFLLVINRNLIQVMQMLMIVLKTLQNVNIISSFAHRLAVGCLRHPIVLAGSFDQFTLPILSPSFQP